MAAESKSVEVIIKGQQANATLREIQASARVLRAELAKLPVNSKEFADKSKDLAQINKRLKSINDDVKGVGGVFNKIGKEIKAFGIVAAGALGFQWLTSKVSNLISQNAKLSDSFSDIRKTTGMTEQEVNKLNKAFTQMNTRSTTAELRDIAIAAGQLGISKKDILSFTAATDKLVVALGDEFTGGAEEVTKEMGALRNIFSDIKSDKIDEDMLRIGNAVNELGASGMATGPVVTDFANRIGGVGISLGLTSGQVLGLSATLQELNVSTERGGTAITKILLKMTQKTDEFSKVAGMSTKEFTDLVNKDLYGAFVKVAEGATKTGGSATQFSKILDELGVDGAGASEVFAKLGKNTGLLQEKVDLANVSLQNTDSIMNEFNIKNENAAANVERIGKWLSKAFVNSTILKGMESITGWLAKMTINTHAASEAMQEEQRELELTKIKVLSLKEGTKERTAAIKTLQEQYPDYLGNLDAEKVSNQELRTAIDKVNESLVNKIIVQRKAEEMAEQAEEIADVKEQQMEAEAKLQSALNNAYKENELAVKKYGTTRYKVLQDELDGLPVQEQAEKLLKATNSGLRQRGSAVSQLNGALTRLKQAEADYNTESKKGNEIQAEKEALMKKLGIDPSAAGIVGKTDDEVVTITTTEGELSDKLLKIKDQLDENIKQLNTEAYNKTLGDDARELAQIDQKYEALLLKAKGFKAEEDKLNMLYIEEYTDVLQNQLIKQGEVDKKTLDEKKKVQEKIRLALLTSNQQEIESEKAKWETLIIEAEKHGQNTELLKIAQLKAIEDLEVKQAERDKERKEKEDSAEIKRHKKYIKQREFLLSEFTATANDLATLHTTVQNNKDAEQVANYESTLASKLRANDLALEKEKISQKQHDANALKYQRQFENQKESITKSAIEREKKLKLAQIAMNLAVELSNIAVASAANPTNAITFGAAGISQYAIQSALALTRAGIQAATISATKYAMGGYNSSNDPQGYTSGPTYYTNSASGSNFIAGEEGKEWIGPNWMLQNPKTAPIFEYLEVVRKNRGFVEGGSTAVPKSTTQPNLINYTSDNVELTKAINNLNMVLSNGVVAYLDYNQYRKTLDDIDASKNYARVG